MSKWRLIGPKVPDRVWSSHLLIARRFDDEGRGIVWSRLSADDWAKLDSGQRQDRRVLLILHGTGLRTRLGFAGMTKPDFDRLANRYGGRILAFEHRALGHHLDRNSSELATELQKGRVPLELDVVGLSRGGLVARMLVEGWEALDHKIRIHKLIFVGTPNEGSPGARWDRSVAREMQAWRRDVRRLALVDQPERELDLYEDPSSIPGHRVDSLECRTWPMLLGSQDQLPRSPWLQRLNGFAGPATYESHSSDCDYYAVASVFTFEHGAPNDMVLPDLSREEIAELAFPNTPNDLVVPTAGVYRPEQGDDACGRFPLEADKLIVLRPSCNVTHVGLLHMPAVRERMLTWLDA